MAEDKRVDEIWDRLRRARLSAIPWPGSPSRAINEFIRNAPADIEFLVAELARARQKKQNDRLIAADPELLDEILGRMESLDWRDGAQQLDDMKWLVERIRLLEEPLSWALKVLDDYDASDDQLDDVADAIRKLLP